MVGFVATEAGHRDRIAIRGNSQIVERQGCTASRFELLDVVGVLVVVVDLVDAAGPGRSTRFARGRLRRLQRLMGRRTGLMVLGEVCRGWWVTMSTSSERPSRAWWTSGTKNCRQRGGAKAPKKWRPARRRCHPSFSTPQPQRSSAFRSPFFHDVDNDEGGYIYNTHTDCPSNFFFALLLGRCDIPALPLITLALTVGPGGVLRVSSTSFRTSGLSRISLMIFFFTFSALPRRYVIESLIRIPKSNMACEALWPISSVSSFEFIGARTRCWSDSKLHPFSYSPS